MDYYTRIYCGLPSVSATAWDGFLQKSMARMIGQRYKIYWNALNNHSASVPVFFNLQAIFSICALFVFLSKYVVAFIPLLAHKARPNLEPPRIHDRSPRLPLRRQVGSDVRVFFPRRRCRFRARVAASRPRICRPDLPDSWFSAHSRGGLPRKP